MIKYVSYAVTFAEVPDEISLTLAISNCGGHCPGCHSPELRQDIGRDLEADLPALLKKYKGQITCVCFLGQGNDPEALKECLEYVKYHGLNTCLYTGSDSFSPNISPTFSYLDYIKVGPYIEGLGGLDSPTTNQRMYKRCAAKNAAGVVLLNEWFDITSLFRRKKQ